MKARDLQARRIGLGLLLGAATLAFAGAGGAASGTVFRSKEYHYSLMLPGGSSGWTLSPAVDRWTSAGLMGLDSPAFDDLSQSARGWNVVVADRPLAAGVTLRAWTKAVVGMAPASCQTPRIFVNTTLDDVPAQLFRHACSDGFDVTKLTAIHQHKGYIILFASNTSNTAASDARFFGALRRSFRFSR
jgi:hypothetical protein